MKSRRLFGYLATVFVSLSLHLAAVRAQEPHEPQAVDPNARAAFEAGRDAYQAGRFGDALKEFDRAYAISSHPVLLYNIGRAAEADLQNERAIQAYEAYLVALQRAENREFVEARLTKLRQSGATGNAGVMPAPLADPSPTPLPMPTPTLAVQRQDRWRLYGGLHLGVGGKLKDGDVNLITLGPTFGGQVGGAFLWKYFGIGAELRVSSFDYKVGERVLVLDLVVKPRVGVRLERIPLELYAALPFGGSPYANLPYTDSLDYDIGFTVGATLGATYFFTPRVGVNAELAFDWHEFDYKDVSSSYSDGTLKHWQVRPLVVNLMVAL